MSEPTYKIAHEYIERQKDKGLAKYGKLLDGTPNGRRPLKDLAEELTDALVYTVDAERQIDALIEYVARLEGAVRYAKRQFDSHAGEDIPSEIMSEVLATSPLSGQPQPAPAMSEREKRMEEVLLELRDEYQRQQHKDDGRALTYKWSLTRIEHALGQLLHETQQLEPVSKSYKLPATATGWRPIAEAPLDGTSIEAGEPDSGWVRVVQYASEQGAWYLLGSADAYYAADFFKVFRPVPVVPAPPQEGE
jgi:hypothetical protein